MCIISPRLAHEIVQAFDDHATRLADIANRLENEGFEASAQAIGTDVSRALVSALFYQRSLLGT